jgi:hypothetical protein
MVIALCTDSKVGETVVVSLRLGEPLITLGHLATYPATARPRQRPTHTSREDKRSDANR